MKTADCGTCAGLGLALTRYDRDGRGRIVAVTFDLTRPCPVCGGTGERQRAAAPIIGVPLTPSRLQ
jgi:hypothetical protein